MRTYKGRSYFREPQNDNGPGFKKKLAIQSGVCIIIIALIFAIKSINSPFAGNIKNTLYYTVDYETTVRSIMNYVKSVPQMWNKDAKENNENDNNTIPQDIPDTQPDTAGDNI